MTIIFWVVGILMFFSCLGACISFYVNDNELTFSQMIAFFMMVFCTVVIIYIAYTGGIKIR